MGDRDSDHLLMELQEARAEIDKLRSQIKELSEKYDTLLMINRSAD